MLICSQSTPTCPCGYTCERAVLLSTAPRSTCPPLLLQSFKWHRTTLISMGALILQSSRQQAVSLCGSRPAKARARTTHFNSRGRRMLPRRSWCLMLTATDCWTCWQLMPRRSVALFSSTDPPTSIRFPSSLFFFRFLCFSVIVVLSVFGCRELQLGPEGAIPRPLAEPHSNAIVDLDGDCQADLVVFSTLEADPRRKVMEVWRAVPAAPVNFALHASYTLPASAGQVSFGDFDRDGATDAIFLVCTSLQLCSIHILYAQRPKRPSALHLCRADPSMFFARTEDHISTVEHVVTGLEVPLASSGDDARLPPTLRLGDWDSDGYPDAIALGYDPTTALPTPVLLMNVPCTEALCGAAAAKRNLRTLRAGRQLPAMQESAVVATFIDLTGNGRPDVLVASRDLNSAYHLTVIRNNDADFEQTFVLKALVLNGVCPAWCQSGDRFPKTKPYGGSYPGATVTFGVTEVSGRTHTRHEAQLTQSAFSPLQLPYILCGLGRTNSYIETLQTGIARSDADTATHTWTTIIPNSQLIVFPSEPGVAGSKWQIELFINPSASWPGVVSALVVSLLAVSILIVYFHFREKWEDQAEKRATAHLFNFDAL
eukprot:TRINITY_DN5209_c0_g1_i1.p1 TRINITY_DN5209_c0_g1~~TRINITY_DN5209_c0_g1_i1.p1  ORF type:complete len:599 (+),score=58.43 TRINITY_DN5209_c0_g1_i1:107-1903(+)